MQRSLSQVLLPLVRGTGLLDGLIPRAHGVLLFLTAFIFTVGRAVPSGWGMDLLDVAAIYLALFLVGLGRVRAAHYAGYSRPTAMVGCWLVVGLELCDFKGYPCRQVPFLVRVRTMVPALSFRRATANPPWTGRVADIYVRLAC